MRDLARDDLLAELRALRPLFEREGVVRMSLFGSRARGDNRPDSDVDIIVDIEEGRKFSMLDAIGVGHVIEDRLGLQSSVLTRPGLQENLAFETRVRREEVEVF